MIIMKMLKKVMIRLRNINGKIVQKKLLKHMLSKKNIVTLDLNLNHKIIGNNCYIIRIDKGLINLKN